MRNVRWTLLSVGIAAASLAVTPAAALAADPPPWMGDIPGLANVAPDETPADAPIRLEGCTQTLDLFPDKPDRVRQFVPARYELGHNAYFGPGTATIFASLLDCQGASVEGEPAAPVRLAMIGAQLRSGPAVGDHPFDPMWDAYNRSTLNFLPSSSWYLMTAQTNNPDVAASLRRSGLEVETVQSLTFDTQYFGSAKSDRVDVPSAVTPWRAETTTMFPDCCFVHNHDFVFWQDGPQGTGSFLQHLHSMIDSSCGYQAHAAVHSLEPRCGGKVEAAPGSELATFLGGSSRQTSMVFNHPDSRASGYLTVPPRG
jgi:hypothetical protein